VRAQQLSERQAQILGFFREYAARNQGWPTVREVTAHIGVGAQRHLRTLVAKGYLSHVRQARGYHLAEHEPAFPPPDYGDPPSSPPPANDSQRARGADAPTRIPIVGRVPAGSPSSQEEEHRGYLELPIGVSPKAFAVQVSGDSMHDAHILDGDFVIADPALESTDRSVVIASIGGAHTVKTLRQTENGWWLEPANERYPPIMPDLDGDRIDAPVVALFRPQINKRPRGVPWP
jgi:repressor LexA